MIYDFEIFFPIIPKKSRQYYPLMEWDQVLIERETPMYIPVEKTYRHPPRSHPTEETEIKKWVKRHMVSLREQGRDISSL
jgi:hypothetical protein